MSDRKYVVYKHTNKVNGKVYIGITYDINKRWKCDGCAYKQNKHFWNAIQKYGWDGFEHEIVYSDLSHEDACAIEMMLISELNATNPKNGYNKSPGGAYPLIKHCGKEHPMFGKHHSEESKRKMSEAKCGDKHPCYGKHLSEDTKRKIGEANSKHRLTDEQKEHLRQINLGKKQSQSTIEKRSKSMMGHSVSEETRKKISNSKEKKPVMQMSLDNIVIAIFDSVSAAAASSNLATTQISKCCKGILKTTGGFKWQYVNNL